MVDTLHVMIADDHPVVRMGLASMIELEPGFSLVGTAANGAEAVALYRQLRPDVALMDLRMPQLDGVAAIEHIRTFDPAARIVILTTFDGEEEIFRGLRAGARGYLLKDAPSEQVLDCIRAVAGGRRYLPLDVASKLAQRMDTAELSARELQVLELIAGGMSNKQVAQAVSITEGTVKFHVNNILSKLGVDSRTEAVTLALKRGIIRIA
ncbi:response regulator [Noviherbaspirillum denitrificans]|uniref:LuxR family transcriptional regulator n=1 Tax=Noviherbaspirillum denitrificans TaxID=1968433 RepID=A0A254TEW0_9BURK|nr:response regulator transcription factor [Noviherbaspirillum denitrificans]OWW21199.1 LuxR family transcriptional regulator [Noviherbaspirillum denitrificans]